LNDAFKMSLHRTGNVQPFRGGQDQDGMQRPRVAFGTCSLHAASRHLIVTTSTAPETRPPLDRSEWGTSIASAFADRGGNEASLSGVEHSPWDEGTAHELVTVLRKQPGDLVLVMGELRPAATFRRGLTVQAVRAPSYRLDAVFTRITDEDVAHLLLPMRYL
jgi:hypothetical protein